MALPSSSSRNLQQRFFLMLQGCKSTAELARLHAQLVVRGFSRKNFLLTKMLSFCISSGHLSHAALAFSQVDHPSTTLCNQLIRAFSRFDDTPHRSLAIYRRMRSGLSPSETQPNAFTYAFLLGGCARSGPRLSRRLGQQLHARVVADGLGSSVYIQTNLVNMYAASSEEDSLAKARMVFDAMPHRNIVSCNSMLAGYLRWGDLDSACKFFHHMPCAKDKVSWTTMIAGCTQSSKCKQSLTLYREMLRAQVRPDHVTLVCLLSSSADLGLLVIGRSIHALIYSVLRGGGAESVSNALIHMYIKCGSVEDGFQAFQEMAQRSTVSWTTMITGFAMHGRSDDALCLFYRMQQLSEKQAESQKPDWLTFVAVLCACSYSGKVVDGYRYFIEMSATYGITPRIQHYCCMIDMLSRAGHLAKAQEMIRIMPMQPNYAIWGALLSGCSHHGDIMLANQVLDRLLELKPNEYLGYLVLLSNLYAAASMWGDVYSIKQRKSDIRNGKMIAASSSIT